MKCLPALVKMRTAFFLPVMPAARNGRAPESSQRRASRLCVKGVPWLSFTVLRFQASSHPNWPYAAVSVHFPTHLFMCELSQIVSYHPGAQIENLSPPEKCQEQPTLCVRARWRCFWFVLILEEPPLSAYEVFMQGVWPQHFPIRICDKSRLLRSVIMQKVGETFSLTIWLFCDMF